ncbi:MAG TPA: biopolymer transporter ExbD [Bdellovibrionales bacterium]|nr:biopolymer transporter ExbD [Bdellovibrionales bacterium]
MAGGAKIRGNSGRLIKPPGYHLLPEWDLTHLRHVIETRRYKKAGFSLSLAPMVDMFSILVIYLLMNFSSSGEIFFVSKDIVLPRAVKGVPMASHPLISIVGQQVMFDAEKVEGQAGVTTTESNDGESPKLRAMLRRIKRIERQISPDKAFRGQVNLQAGQETDVDEVKKVMRVLIEEGWTGINFVVDPRAQ